MTLYEAIRLARKALASTFGLVISNGRAAPGYGSAHSDADQQEAADAYNKLASFHARASRIDQEDAQS